MIARGDVTESLCKLVEKKVSAGAFKAVRKVALHVRQKSMCDELIFLNLLTEGGIVDQRHEFTLIKLTNGFVLLFTGTPEQIASRIRQIPDPKVRKTPRKTLVKMALNRIVKISKILEAYDHAALFGFRDDLHGYNDAWEKTGESVPDTSMRRESIDVGLMELIGKKFMTALRRDRRRSARRDVIEFLKREDVTGDILDEAWILFQVKEIMET